MEPNSSGSWLTNSTITVHRTDRNLQLEVIEYSPRGARLVLSNQAKTGSQFPVVISGRSNSRQCLASIEWVTPVNDQFVVAGVKFVASSPDS